MKDYDTVEVFEIRSGLLLIFEFQNKIKNAALLFGYLNPSKIREFYCIPKTIPIYFNPDYEFWGGHEL